VRLLTTRWSGPGQGGAILRGSLGRAAQLEAVRPPFRPCDVGGLMNKRLILLTLLLLALVALALTTRMWIPALLRFMGVNSNTIQALESSVQLVIWLAIGITLLVRFVRRPAKAPVTRLASLLKSLPQTRRLDYYKPSAQAWRRDLRNTLAASFGEGSRVVTDYDNIAWRTSDRPEDAADQQALYQRSWAAAEGVLRAAIESLRNEAA